MVKILHLKNCGVWLEKLWSKWSRFENQKYDRESVGQSWSKWSGFSIWKSMGSALRKYGPNGQDLQSKNVTESLWDSHGQNGQYFPSEQVWGFPWEGMVQMVKICKAKIWQRVCGTVMVKMVKIFHLKKCGVFLEIAMVQMVKICKAKIW